MKIRMTALRSAGSFLIFLCFLLLDQNGVFQWNYVMKTFGFLLVISTLSAIISTIGMLKNYNTYGGHLPDLAFEETPFDFQSLMDVFLLVTFEIVLLARYPYYLLALLGITCIIALLRINMANKMVSGVYGDELIISEKCYLMSDLRDIDESEDRVIFIFHNTWGNLKIERELKLKTKEISEDILNHLKTYRKHYDED